MTCRSYWLRERGSTSISGSWNISTVYYFIDRKAVEKARPPDTDTINKLVAREVEGEKERMKLLVDQYKEK